MHIFSIIDKVSVEMEPNSERADHIHYLVRTMQ
jgi:hypothetical protein